MMGRRSGMEGSCKCCSSFFSSAHCPRHHHIRWQRRRPRARWLEVYSVVLPDGHKVDGRFHHDVQIAKVGLEVRVSVSKEDTTSSILEKEGVAVRRVPSKEGHGETDIWCRHLVAEEEALLGEEQIQLGELVVHALASCEDGLVLDAAVDEEAEACLVHAVEESVVDV